MSQSPQHYLVTWPVVQVRYASPQAHGDYQIGGITVMRGRLLPPDVDPEQLAHLIRMGMVEPVEPAGTTEPVAAGAETAA